MQVTWQAYSKVVPLEEVWKIVQIFRVSPEFLIRPACRRATFPPGEGIWVVLFGFSLQCQPNP